MYPTYRELFLPHHIMTTSITQPLPTPVRMGDLDLRNRIVMAPLTRMRADNADRAPTELHARYYEQRASAGLIIGECTAISPAAYGWADTPVCGAPNRCVAGAA
jgi:N-ethylmaleimide reductase